MVAELETQNKNPNAGHLRTEKDNIGGLHIFLNVHNLFKINYLVLLIT